MIRRAPGGPARAARPEHACGEVSTPRPVSSPPPKRAASGSARHCPLDARSRLRRRRRFGGRRRRSIVRKRGEQQAAGGWPTHSPGTSAGMWPGTSAQGAHLVPTRTTTTVGRQPLTHAVRREVTPFGPTRPERTSRGRRRVGLGTSPPPTPNKCSIAHEESSQGALLWFETRSRLTAECFARVGP